MARLEGTPRFTERKYIVTLIFVTSLFMLWGIAITMGDILNRHFQTVLNITKSESSNVQFSIFGAYAIMAIPAGLFMKRFGYKRGVLLGLFLYAVGAFLFAPASEAESFTFFRFALFVLACGLATLETVAHPFVASLGDQRSSDQRINFAQSFNGLGAVIGPLLGAFFLFRSGNVKETSLDSVETLYLAIGGVITAIAILFAFVKVPALTDPHGSPETSNVDTEPGRKLFQHRHFIWASIAQFFNVAAQGGTWAYFINYAVEKTPGLTDREAAVYFSGSMVMMMCGRFLSTFLMRYIAPNKLLATYAVCNAILCVIIAQNFGTPSLITVGTWSFLMSPSLIALMGLNFFMSIMFPTIFSLGLKNLGPHTQLGSSYIVMGVVGGAIFPKIMGIVADTDIAASYYLPIICYAVIFLFAVKFYKVNGVRAAGALQ